MTQKYVNSALSGSPPASTFALQMLRDKQRKLELAGRMHDLWENSGHTQEAVAEAIGLKHRSYQKALQTGGISYEKLGNLADFHGVEIDWLLRGDEPEATPDPFPADPYAEQFREINEKLDEILKRLHPAKEGRDGGLPAPSPLGPSRPPNAPSKDEPATDQEEHQQQGE